MKTSDMLAKPWKIKRRRQLFFTSNSTPNYYQFNNTLKPKEQGGWGILDVNEFNLALFGK